MNQIPQLYINLVHQLNPFYYIMKTEKKSRDDSPHQRHKKSHKDKHKKQYKRNHHKRSRSRSKEHQYRSSRHHHHRQQKQFKQQRAYEQIGKKIEEKKIQIIKQLPSFEPSGILLQFYNAREGISLKFHEPPESRPPIDLWQIYIFKGQDVSQPISLTNSAYLFGKDQRVCDILCENPSISRQHSVLQFRMMPKMNIDGTYTQFIKPYIMDLQSTNGTFLNDQKMEESRYYELLHKDVLKFGFSDRQYVLVKQEAEQQVKKYQDEEE